MDGIERWQGRVALVTGASSGIGEGMARALGGAGMKVALAARRQDRLEALADELDGAAATLVQPCDVTDPAAVDVLFERVQAEWGAIDLVMNNAGAGWSEPIYDAEPAHLQQIFETNVTGFAYVLRGALRRLRDRPDSLIVNLSSIFAHYPQVPGWTAYHASKAAVKALCDTARREAFEAGGRTRIAMISPGIVATEFREKSSGGARSYDSYFSDFPPLTPADIADAVLYMMATPPHVVVQDILLAPIGQGL